MLSTVRRRSVNSIRSSRCDSQRTELRHSRKGIADILAAGVKRVISKCVCLFLYVSCGSSYLSDGRDDFPDTACQANSIVNINDDS